MQTGDGLVLKANASDDWESGTNRRIECMQCFESFELRLQVCNGLFKRAVASFK